MDEDVIPQLVQLPIDKIGTKTYSFTVEIPINPEIPDFDDRGKKIDKGKALEFANSPDFLAQKTIDLAISQWKSPDSNDRLKNIPIPVRRILHSFFWKNHSKITNSDKPILSVKYVVPVDDIAITLSDGKNGKVVASQSTKCVRITCQRIDEDLNRVGSTVLAVYKNSLILDDSTETWYSSISKSLKLKNEDFQTLLKKAIPFSSSDGSIETLSIRADSIGYKLLPKYINGIKFIDSSEPKLVLDEFEVIFKVNNTREVELAKMIFRKDEESLYGLVEYDELSEHFSGSEEEWFSMSESEKKKFRDEMERASRQLGNRIAKMIGSAECVISAEKYGLRVKSEFLKPKE